MAPKLKCYTTTIKAAQSIGEIQGLLVEFGAEKVMMENKERQTVGITFTFMVRGQELPFRLPVDIKKLAAYMYKDYQENTTRGRKTHEDFLRDGYNIGWRIVRDWVHAQLSILATETVDPAQVFLPYLLTDGIGGPTLSQKFLDGDLPALLPPALEG